MLRVLPSCSDATRLGCRVIHFHCTHQSLLSTRTSLSVQCTVRDWLVTTGFDPPLLQKDLYVYIHIFMYFIHMNCVYMLMCEWAVCLTISQCLSCVTVFLLLYFYHHSAPPTHHLSLLSPSLYFPPYEPPLFPLSSLCCNPPTPLPLSQASCSLVIGCCVGWWLWFQSAMSPEHVPAYCFRTVEASTESLPQTLHVGPDYWVFRSCRNQDQVSSLHCLR